MKRLSAFLSALPLPVLGFLCGCHSYQIDATVENRTGAAIELLEVDYPSASFGADTLASGADFHYRFQVRGSGPVKVQYTEDGSYKVRQMSGTEVFEHQEGRLEIVLLPEGKAEFRPQLSPHL
ncbi:MAG TPA: hypothetical protein VMR02_10470 [Terracidiphilus sp.]|nr:hypothetical protein [Terracidiphilus sp.]